MICISMTFSKSVTIELGKMFRATNFNQFFATINGSNIGLLMIIKFATIWYTNT